MKLEIIFLLFMISALIIYYEYEEGLITNFLNDSSYQIPMVKIKPNITKTKKINYTEHDFLELELEIHRLVNEERRNHGLEVLKWNDDLARVARVHSQDMMNRNFFSHINPDDLDSKDRIERGNIYYFNKTGENLYRLITMVNQSILAKKCVDGWMNSPNHREIILDGDFDEAGVGIAYSKGTDYGIDYYITQNFISKVECGYKGGECCPSPSGYLPSCYVPYECISGVCQ